VGLQVFASTGMRFPDFVRNQTIDCPQDWQDTSNGCFWRISSFMMLLTVLLSVSKSRILFVLVDLSVGSRLANNYALDGGSPFTAPQAHRFQESSIN
jgi:hypothetical protein